MFRARSHSLCILYFTLHSHIGLVYVLPHYGQGQPASLGRTQAAGVSKADTDSRRLLARHRQSASLGPTQTAGVSGADTGSRRLLA